MDLTIQQLRVVLAVADAGTFTAAGERMHLAQSSLSRTVADVERRIGVTLFQRNTRTVLLTTEGQEFVRVASAVVASFDTGMNHFAGFLDGSRGTVRIATLPSLAATLLPPIVAKFRKEHPQVEISIEDALLGQVLERVTGGHVDFAITVTSGTPTRLSIQHIALDEFCCVFTRSHRFQAASMLQWADLAGEPFIAFDRTSSVREHADRAFDQAAIVPGPVTEARNIAAVAGLVAAGLGVSVVPSLVLPLLEFAHLDHRPLIPTVTRAIGVVHDPQRPLAPAAQAFLHTIAGAQSSGLELPDGARWLASTGPVRGLSQP